MFLSPWMIPKTTLSSSGFITMTTKGASAPFLSTMEPNIPALWTTTVFARSCSLKRNTTGRIPLLPFPFSFPTGRPPRPTVIHGDSWVGLSCSAPVLPFVFPLLVPFGTSFEESRSVWFGTVVFVDPGFIDWPDFAAFSAAFNKFLSLPRRPSGFFSALVTNLCRAFKRPTSEASRGTVPPFPLPLVLVLSVSFSVLLGLLTLGSNFLSKSVSPASNWLSTLFLSALFRAVVFEPPVHLFQLHLHLTRLVRTAEVTAARFHRTATKVAAGGRLVVAA